MTELNRLAVLDFFSYFLVKLKTSLKACIASNQMFHYTRLITPKRVTSWRGPSPRHCAQATQLLSKKCRSGGDPLATLCPI